MLNNQRANRGIALALGICCFGLGCTTTSAKIGEQSFLKKNAPLPQGIGSASPGSADLTIKKKLTNPVKVHLACALWHEQEGRYFDARNSYEKVLEKSSKNIEANLGLARLDIQLKRMSDAEARLEKVLKLDPKNPQVEAAFGQYFAAQEHWPEALEHLHRAKALSPYDPTYSFQLGIVQARSGDSVAAFASLKESVGEVEGHYNLAVVLNEMGQKEQAKQHLEQALAIKPGMPLAEKLLTAMRDEKNSGDSGSTTSATANISAGKSDYVQPTGFLPPVQ